MTEDMGDQPPTDPAAGETRLLSEREGRRAPRSRVDAVPDALRTPLRQWLQRFVHRNEQLEERVAVRLELELAPRDRIPRSVGPPRELTRHSAFDRGDLLLDAIDLVLQWDEALNNQWGLQQLLPASDDGEPDPRFTRLPALARLDRLLDDGGSTYQVWAPFGAATPTLTVRVDPSLQAAADGAIATAEVRAADRLRSAWSRAYGRDEDPDPAYFDALRAVEMLACPLVLPKNTRAVLNDVAKHLSSPGGAAKWELALTKLGDGSVEPIAAMFDRLWHGNLKSRHGGLTHREVTLEEARAAVQLAVVLVQWLTDGVLRPRPSTGPS